MKIKEVKYYKTKKEIIFNDGYEVRSGTIVQMNFSEGEIHNVQIKNKNEKRIFWVHDSDLQFYKNVNEKWLKEELEEHDIDVNEKWLEYEKQKLAKSKNKRTNSGSKTKKRICRNLRQSNKRGGKMKFRETTSVTLDSETIKEAKTWATEEHLQLSSYIQEAVEMRNKWHQRNEEKEKMKTNLLTKEQAKEELLAELAQKAKANQEDADIQRVTEIAREMWGK